MSAIFFVSLRKIAQMKGTMDCKSYLISVIYDTLERINDDAELMTEFTHHFLTIEFAVYCPPRDNSNYITFKVY